ncbi:hypothetical protein ACMXYR_03935 [Neptuniibacter sp. QD29_5]|uniref:hypothetical protein n=1 Tax=Neptuniibacter sp. QD29_5 TaxID=3398207 RepID=UPI0039F4B408
MGLCAIAIIACLGFSVRGFSYTVYWFGEFSFDADMAKPFVYCNGRCLDDGAVDDG